MNAPAVVIDLVGAIPGHFDDPALFPELARIFGAAPVRPLRPGFPAVTCPVQVSMLTGSPPSEHGVIANGLFDRAERTVTMWTWPASRIDRPLVWETLRERRPDCRTAVMFFQGLKGAGADILVNPHPKHTPDGRTLPWCDSRPEGLYEELVRKLGHFPLHKYWGPMADIESSRWILAASRHVLERLAPELALVYVPHLDYVGQRCGPESAAFAEEARRVDALVAEFISDLDAAAPTRPDLLLVSEYAMVPVSRGVLPNVALRDAGLLSVSGEAGEEHLDLTSSRAFAMVDHQVAHVYVDAEAADAAASLLGALDGVAEVCRGERLRELGVAHPNTGELVLLAEPDAWFAYYWWHEPHRAPAFARTVDIHRKPGYDPVELFLDPASKSIPLDANLVRGSHGVPAGATGHGLVALRSGALPGEGAIEATGVRGMLDGLVTGRKRKGS